jgi:hypothetical protein
MTDADKALVYAAALQCSSTAAISVGLYNPENFDAIVADSMVIAEKMIDAIEAK